MATSGPCWRRDATEPGLKASDYGTKKQHPTTAIRGDFMSKQTVAKAAQGYVPKAIPQTCMNCDHFSIDIVSRIGWDKREYFDEKNMRCTFGGFAVTKMATCNEFVGKAAA